MMRRSSIILSFLILSSCLIGSFSYGQEMAHFDQQAVFQSMPERQKAQKKMQQFQQNLQKDIQEMNQEYQKKMQELQQGSEEMTETERKMKRDELKTLQKRIRKANNKMSENVRSQRQELLKPIREKLERAVKAVAEEEGYSYVIPKSVCVHCGGPDLTEEVKAKLKEQRRSASEEGAEGESTGGGR